MPAQASLYANVCDRLLISTPRSLKEPPKYCATIAPIIESTVAILSAVKTNGRAVGTRTRRKISIWLAAYECMSSSDSGRTEVRPRRVFTSTGKKQRTAAIAIFELFENGENHASAIGAKAMIGKAFAAIAYGMRATPSLRQRASESAKRLENQYPIAMPHKVT